MDTDTIVSLVKDRLGIRTDVRDSYISVISESVIKELEDEKGLSLDEDNPYHLMFVVDYSTWRYQSVTNMDNVTTGNALSLPRHLQFRLHNLVLHVGAK